MNFLFEPLTLVTFFPLVGVLVLLFLKPEQKNAARWTALVTSLITFGISIAVLPLVNLSGDASQEFFSDGITEEITSALAKIPDLKVVARRLPCRRCFQRTQDRSPPTR